MSRTSQKQEKTNEKFRFKKLILSLFLATYALPSIAAEYEGSLVQLYDYLHFHYADDDGDGRLSKQEFEWYKEWRYYGNDIESPDFFINQYNDYFFPEGQNYITAPDFFDTMYKIGSSYPEEAFEATFNTFHQSHGFEEDEDGPIITPAPIIQEIANRLEPLFGGNEDVWDFIEELNARQGDLTEWEARMHLDEFMDLEPFDGVWPFIEYYDDYYDNLDYDYDDPVDPVEPEPKAEPVSPSANIDIKRIYTVDQAVATVKNNKNTFSLRYR